MVIKVRVALYSSVIDCSDVENIKFGESFQRKFPAKLSSICGVHGQASLGWILPPLLNVVLLYCEKKLVGKICGLLKGGRIGYLFRSNRLVYLET